MKEPEDAAAKPKWCPRATRTISQGYEQMKLDIEGEPVVLWLSGDGEKLGLSEKNLVYLIVVIFACHRSLWQAKVTKIR